LGVELVGAAHDLGLNLEEAVDELLSVEREPVALGLLFERVEDPLLPIDQGAVAIGGDPRDVFELWNCHDGGRGLLWILCRGLGTAAPWIYSSIRASSCSPGTACRCRRAGTPARSTRPWPPRPKSATPAWLRPRSRSAAAARRAASKSPRTRSRPGHMP